MRDQRVLMIVVGLAAGALMGACSSKESPDVQIANPASTNCVDKGYTLELREGPGGTGGYCKFPDGTECEEWAFFRGECTKGERASSAKTVKLDEKDAGSSIELGVDDSLERRREGG